MSTTSSSHILVERDDALARVTLNRPEKLNAFAGTMRTDLAEALRSIAADAGIRVVVITGAGRAFCSGGDVDYMTGLQKAQDLDRFYELLAAGKAVVTQIRTMPQIVIASVNGVAAGAGCNLALACDYRIASHEAKFAQSFVKIGLHPDWGGTYFLPRLVGPSKALEIMATGRLVAAQEAVSIGMVDRMVDANELASETDRLAKAIAAGPSAPLRGIKRAVYASFASDLETQIELENAHQLEAFRSADAAEGMAAFAEKRPAKFNG